MPARQSLRRKACNGKTRYRSQGEAETQLKRLALLGENMKHWNWYHCGFCGLYHTGHLSAAVNHKKAERARKRASA